MCVRARSNRWERDRRCGSGKYFDLRVGFWFRCLLLVVGLRFTRTRCLCCSVAFFHLSNARGSHRPHTAMSCELSVFLTPCTALVARLYTRFVLYHIFCPCCCCCFSFVIVSMCVCFFSSLLSFDSLFFPSHMVELGGYGRRL